MFNSKQYEILLTIIKKSNRKIFRICDCANVDLNKVDNFIILRHDVDDNIKYAVTMADMENSFGVYSTYYIRRKPRVWKPKMISYIASLGHEIGYHYEVLSAAKGDIKKAKNIFLRELIQLRKYAEVSTCCMHGNIFSKWDNRDFWKIESLSSYGLTMEAYLSLSNFDIYYFSDSGYTWSNKYCVYDHFEGKYLPISTTKELCSLILSKEIRGIYLLTHPILWMGNNLHIFWQAYKEQILKLIKYIIITARRRKK